MVNLLCTWGKNSAFNEAVRYSEHMSERKQHYVISISYKFYTKDYAAQDSVPDS